MSECKIVLKTTKGTKFEIDEESARLSKLIETTLGSKNDEENDSGSEEEDDQPVVHEVLITKVPDEDLAVFVKFVAQYKKTPYNVVKPLETNDFTKAIPHKFFRDLVPTDLTRIYSLVNSANYLDCEPFLDLFCTKLATLLKGRTDEELSKTFGVDMAEFTEEVEEKIQEENPWLEDLMA